MKSKRIEWHTKEVDSLDHSRWDTEQEARCFAYGFSHSLPRGSKIVVEKVTYQTEAEYEGKRRNEE